MAIANMNVGGGGVATTHVNFTTGGANTWYTDAGMTVKKVSINYIDDDCAIGTLIVVYNISSAPSSVPSNVELVSSNATRRVYIYKVTG